MKKKLRKCGIVLKIAVLAGAAVYCAAEAVSVREAVREAVERCLFTLIPALYAMMIAAGALARSGCAAYVGRFLDRPAGILFGMTGEELVVFFCGSFTGYLTGAKMLCVMNDEGRVTGTRGGWLLGFCFGAGPAFISGCIAAQLYGSQTVGSLIFLSTAGANILIAFLAAPFIKRHKPEVRKSSHLLLDSKVIMDSTLSAGQSMTEVCFITAAFAVAADILRKSGAMQLIGFVLSGIVNNSGENAGNMLLDVSATSTLPHGDHSMLPLICALVSFGGFCVIFQLAAVCRGKFSLVPFTVVRSAAAVLSFILCRGLMPYFLRNETVAVSTVHASVHSSPSPVPSIMLCIMTVMLLAGSAHRKK